MTDEKRQPAGDDPLAGDTEAHYLHHAEFEQRVARERDREAERQATDSRLSNEGRPHKRRRSLFRR